MKSSRWHQVSNMQPSDHVGPQCHVVIYGRNFDFIAHSKQLGITLLATFLLSSRFKLPYTRSLGIFKKQTLVCNLQVSKALKSRLWTITVFKNNTSYCVETAISKTVKYDDTKTMGEPTSARWQYRSRIKDISFCFEKKFARQKSKQQLFIRDQYCHLAVMAPY